ncbi:MAG: DNA polymerase IV [Woeseiaceae bacterium]
MRDRRHRSVLHVDMDAFFASVEQHDDPKLLGKPVLVGGSSNRGVVAAASYEARRFGVRSAMPIREALRLCPQAICVRSNLNRYREVSKIVFNVFREFTPEVEGLSLDEAFLDVTASRDLFGGPVDIAKRIKTLIHERTGLRASVGVATNKLVAKVASDLDKPDGLTIVRPGTEAERLAPLDASVLPGIGPRMQTRLKASGIVRIADLQSADERALTRLFGKYAAQVRERAFGRDHRPVVPWRDEKSVSAETTFENDVGDIERLRRILLGLCDKTATRLRQKQLLAGVVQLKIRRSDFVTVTRQCTVSPPTNVTKRLYQETVQLLDDWRREQPDSAVRLLGVGGNKLTADTQLDLFREEATMDTGRMDKTVDAVRERFSHLGSSALQSASTLKREK